MGKIKSTVLRCLVVAPLLMVPWTLGFANHAQAADLGCSAEPQSKMFWTGLDAG